MSPDVITVLGTIAGTITALFVMAAAVLSFLNNRALAATKQHLSAQDSDLADVHLLVDGRLTQTLEELTASKETTSAIQRKLDLALDRVLSLETFIRTGAVPAVSADGAHLLVLQAPPAAPVAAATEPVAVRLVSPAILDVHVHEDGQKEDSS